MKKFKELAILSKFKIKNIELENRIVMAPMGNHLQGKNGEVTDSLIKYLELRAAGGTGLIITPFASVSPNHPTFGIYSDDLLPGLSRLAKTIKKHGSRVFIQIANLGAMNPNERIAPSAIESPLFWGGVRPRELSTQEITELRNKFIEAGVRAKKVGFDGVEFHGGYSYLVAEFYSPHLNQRADQYGGSFENRMRFLDEVIEGIQNKAGEDFPIGFKLNVHEHVDDGINTDEALRIAKHLEKMGIAYLHIVSSFPLDDICEYTGLPTMYEKTTALISVASIIKKETNVPVIAGGGIVLPEEAEEIIRSGIANLVAIGRGLIADPDWVKKVENNEPIRPCILCNKCHIGEVLEGIEVRCTVNPEAGTEISIPTVIPNKTKKIAVIGGGPAGMEFSLKSAKMGNEIEIYEIKPELGGKMALAGVFPFKKPIHDYIEYMKNEILNTSSIKVNCNKEVSADNTTDIDADVLVCAFGANPIIPNVPGIKNKNVLLATDLIEKIKNDKQLNGMNNFLVLGAGLVGCETAWYLGEIGKKVKIFDLISYNDLLKDEHPLIKSYILKKLRELGIPIFCIRKLVNIDNEKAVFLTESENREVYNFSYFIIATGYTPNNDYYNAILKAASPREVYRIGDCNKGFGCYNSIHDAFQLALRI